MNIEELIGKLQAVNERASNNIGNLERERGYIMETMQKIQANFGNQNAGQQMVTQLYHAMNSLSFADSSLNALKSAISRYINQLRR